MLTRTNPLSLDVVASEVSGDIEAQLKDLEARIEDADEAQSGFIDKQAKLERLRMGHRKPRNIPWKGASNISVPLVDGIIRRIKPGFASLILDANPVAIFDAQGADDMDKARLMESFTTWLLKKRMKIAKPVVQLVDYFLSRGHAFSHEGWDYRTSRSVRIIPVDTLFKPNLEAFLQQAEAAAQQQGKQFNPGDAIVEKLEAEYDLSRENQQDLQVLMTAAQRILEGNKFVRVFYRRVEKDQPAWTPIDPINLIKPVDQTAATADFVALVHRLSADDLVRMARDGLFWSSSAPKPGGFDMDPVEALIAKIKSQNEDPRSQTGGRGPSARDEIMRMRDKKSQVEQTGRATGKPEALVHQAYALLDINGDGVDERVVYWYAPKEGVRLALYEYPLPFDEWPFTTFRFSNDLPRDIDQRGVVELGAAFQKLTNAFENAWIDAANIVLAPMVKERQLAGETESTWSWRPGGKIPFTNSPDDVQPLLQDLRILGELLRGKSDSRTEAETYVGVFDAAIRNVTQRTERRTATEVAAVQSMSDSIFGLDAKLFAESFAESLNKIMLLWLEFGPPEVHIRVEGQDELLPIRREDFSKSFDISPAGTPANTQKAILLRNIEQFLQVTLGQPTIAGSGLVDVAELLKQYLRLLDFPLANQIIRNSEDAAVVQEVLQASAQMNEGRPSGIV